MAIQLTTKTITLIAMCVAFSCSAAENSNQRIDLPNCDVTITADQALTSEQGTTYSGNVKVLIGFANLRTNRITLIRKADGQCELVPDFNE